MLVLREPNFVYSNRHLDLDYRNPMSFSFTNPCFVFLICDWCFVLLSPLRFCICHISREFTLWLRPTSSAGTPIFCERTFDSSQKLEIMVFNVLNKDIFLTQSVALIQMTFINPPELCGAFLWCTFLGLKISTSIYCHYKAWTFLNITLIVFV